MALYGVEVDETPQTTSSQATPYPTAYLISSSPPCCLQAAAFPLLCTNLFPKHKVLTLLAMTSSSSDYAPAGNGTASENMQGPSPKQTPSSSSSGSLESTGQSLSSLTISRDTPSSSTSSLSSRLFDDIEANQPIQTPILDRYYYSSRMTAFKAAKCTQEQWVAIERLAKQEENLERYDIMAIEGQKSALDTLGEESFHSLKTSFPEQWPWVVFHHLSSRDEEEVDHEQFEEPVEFREVCWSGPSLSEEARLEREPVSPRSQPASLVRD